MIDNVNNGFRFYLKENGIAIEFGGRGFILSYYETPQDLDTAIESCNEFGGKLPTPEQWMTITEHMDWINILLEKNGQCPIGKGWYWTRRKDTSGKYSAWVISPELKILGLHPKEREYLTRIIFTL